MQITDLVNQYMSNAGSNEKVAGTKGIHKLASSLRDLSAGSIFEGTVNSIKNGKVVLGLSNGQSITARMAGKVSLTVGESMFFQVKSNEGSQLLIRPFTVAGNQMNLTLMQALQAANLPTDAKHLSMVNTMMQEQMPIDAASLNQMARIAFGNPDINVQTLVQMQKLGIPITEEFASQFENYLDDKQAIGKEMENFIEQLPKTLSNEALSLDSLKQMNSQILQIITEGLQTESEPVNAGVDNNMNPEIITGANSEADIAAEGKETIDSSEMAAANAVPEEFASPEDRAAVGQAAPKEETQVQQQAQMQQETQVQQEEQAEGTIHTQAASTLEEEGFLPVDSHSLKGLLNEQQLTELREQLSAFPKLAENPALFTDGNLNTDRKGVEVLKLLQQMFESNIVTDKQNITRLFSGEGMKNLIRDAIEQQWLIKPEELKKEDKINQLYEKLESQISRMESVVRATGHESPELTQTAAEIRNNVDFMNQMNQVYTYIQIPLKLNGQNASGELFVYTNKKNLAQEGDKEMTAFLHLDLDHLGSTDVSIKLGGRKVDTQFYLENDESFELIRQNLPVLQARLEKKGYNCQLTVNHEGKHVNFVEDFLKKDLPSAGRLHRYSFDMRA